MQQREGQSPSFLSEMLRFPNFKMYCNLLLLLCLQLQQTTATAWSTKDAIESMRGLSLNQPKQAFYMFQTLPLYLKNIHGIQKPATIALNKIISEYNRQKDFDAAINAYEGGKSAGIQIDTKTQSAVIKSYFGEKDTKEANKVFDSMTHKDTITLNTMISGYIDNEQFAEAIQVYEHGYGITKNTKTHNAAIRAYCGAAKTDKAKQIFDGMTHKDTVTLNTMITGYIDNQQFEKAIKIYENASKYGIAKNTITDTVAIKAYCGMKQIKQAKQVFNGMTHKDTITLSTMISGYIDNEEFHNAIQLFHDPKYSHISTNMITRTAVIKAYCGVKDMTAAKKIFDDMTHKDTCTLNTMITGYIDNQQFDKAIKMYENAREYRISKNTITNNAAIKAYCGMKQLKQATQIFDGKTQ